MAPKSILFPLAKKPLLREAVHIYAFCRKLSETQLCRLVECQRSHQLAATAGLHVPAWLQARNESLYALKHAMLANWSGAYHPSLQY